MQGSLVDHTVKNHEKFSIEKHVRKLSNFITEDRFNFEIATPGMDMSSNRNTIYIYDHN